MPSPNRRDLNQLSLFSAAGTPDSSTGTSSTPAGQVPVPEPPEQIPAPVPLPEEQVGMPPGQVPTPTTPEQIPAPVPLPEEQVGIPPGQVPTPAPPEQIPAPVPLPEEQVGIPRGQVPTPAPQKQTPAPTSSAEEQVAKPPRANRAAQSAVKVKLSELDVHPNVEITLRELGLFDMWDQLWKVQTRREPLLKMQGAKELLRSCEFRAVTKDQKILCYSDTWFLKHLQKQMPNATVLIAVHPTVSKQQLRAIVMTEYFLRPLYYRFPAESNWGRRLLAACKKPPLNETLAAMNLVLFSQWTGFSKSSMANRKKN